MTKYQTNQPQQLLTPELKKQFHHLLHHQNQLKQVNKNTFLSSLWQKFYVSTYHFDRTESIKVQRLLSYIDKNKQKIDKQSMNLLNTYNLGILACCIMGVVIPKRLMGKSFSVLGVLMVKAAYLDNIFLFKFCCIQANRNIFTAYSQEFRNVITYYLRKKYQNQDNEHGRLLIEQLISQMEKNTKQFNIIQAKQHLL